MSAVVAWQEQEMRKVSHNDEIAQKMVKAFGKHVIELRSAHRIYKELFESEETENLLDKTAQSFFDDLRIILRNYILLEFAKITDPAESRGEENFTIANIIESVCWPKRVEQKLKILNEKANRFRSYIKETRNKLLAHIDKKIFLLKKKLGGFPKGKDEQFLTILEEICNIIHKACFNSIFGSISVSMIGDVEDLRKALKKGLVFDRLFSESKGAEKAKLFQYLRQMNKVE